MKGILVYVVALSVWVAICEPVQAQSDLEKEVQMIFLRHVGEGEKYDKKAKLEELGHKDEVQTILLNMLTKYKYSRPGTAEFLYLNGSTWMLGAMGVKQSIPPLSNVLVDQRIDPTIRALALRSLGQIDVHENKKLLIRELTNKSNDHLIRVFAAEALAKTKDLKVLRILERCISEERDSHVREKFARSAQELKENLKSQR